MKRKVTAIEMIENGKSLGWSTLITDKYRNFMLIEDDNSFSIYESKRLASEAGKDYLEKTARSYHISMLKDSADKKLDELNHIYTEMMSWFYDKTPKEFFSDFYVEVDDNFDYVITNGDYSILIDKAVKAIESGRDLEVSDFNYLDYERFEN